MIQSLRHRNCVTTMPIYAKMGVSSTCGGFAHNKLTFFKDDSSNNNNRKELRNKDIEILDLRQNLKQEWHA